MRNVLALALLISTSAVAAAGEKNVELKRTDDGRVVVNIGGEQFAVYRGNESGKQPKPYFYPVNGPGEVRLTREIGVKGKDHPHHKGIWVAVDEVNHVKFWAEKNCIIKTDSVELLVEKGSPAAFRVVNHWYSNDDRGMYVVAEETTIRIWPNRLIAYDIQFHANKEDVTFRDTKEGLFGIRMVDSMRERETGKVVAANGGQGTKATWGKPNKWIDYYGKVGGGVFGVAIFDHPKNFRPSRYHVRNYGLFSINPFGDRAYTGGKEPAKPYTLKPDGKPLRLRYAIYVHKGDTKSADVQSAYEDWVKATTAAR